MNYITKVCEIVTAWTYCDPLKNEDVLDLNLASITVNQANNQISNSYIHLKVHPGNQSINGVNLEQVHYDNFDIVFDAATALRSEETNPAATYISGLKIHFGLEGNVIKLLYQPVCMIKRPGQSQYVIHENTFYEVQGGVFVPTGALGSKDDYEKFIRIKHHNSGSHNKIKSLTDPDTDPRSVIFPFQTIFSLMHENSNSNSVIFNSAIRDKDIYNQDNPTIKHCLIMSTGQLLEDKEMSINSAGLIGFFANRSHLCPPKCKDMDAFNVVRTGTNCS